LAVVALLALLVQRSRMGKPTSHEAIILPNNDKLSYRVVELESGLVGVLVSDADTEKAAASLDVSRRRRTSVAAAWRQPLQASADLHSMKGHFGTWVVTLSWSCMLSDVISCRVRNMQVRVGSLLDPPEFQGLAHFLEHVRHSHTSHIVPRVTCFEAEGA
jgi:hypothetical protein